MSLQPYLLPFNPGERLQCYPLIVAECFKDLKTKSLTGLNQLSIIWKVIRPDENEQEDRAAN